MRKIEKPSAIFIGDEKQIGVSHAELPVVDRRLETRAKCYRGGKIIVDELGTAYECIFKDLSWFGARLQMLNSTPLPTSFKIAFAAGNNINPFDCKIAWRDGDNLGVIFTQSNNKTAAA